VRRIGAARLYSRIAGIGAARLYSIFILNYVGWHQLNGTN